MDTQVESTSPYPQCDKLAAVREISQPQGELLEWLSEQGVHLMRWEEWTEPTMEECRRCRNWSASYRRAHDSCPTCGGTRVYEVRRDREGWRRDGRSVEQLLAAFHGIDLNKVEEERQAMLADLRRVTQGG